LRPGIRPGSHWGACSSPLDPLGLAVLKRAARRREEREGKWKGKDGVQRVMGRPGPRELEGAAI